MDDTAIRLLAHSVVAVLVLMAGHMIQVTLWAVLYRFDFDEFRGFGTALYFSLANFTTVGASDLTVPTPIAWSAHSNRRPAC